MLEFIGSREVRPSVISGTWYPGATAQLQSTVDGLMAKAARVTLPGAIVGLVSPHAGYAYSGGVAAHAYAQVRQSSFRTVVLIGPDHRGSTGAYGVAAYQNFETPLGRIPIDDDLLDQLGKRVALDRVVNDEEHSLEIQLPFLQRALGKFSLLPIMMGYPMMPRFGDMALKSASILSDALVDVLEDRDDVLLVASTDLSHLYDYDEVARFDSVFMQLVKEFDPEKLAQALMDGRCQACGGTPVVTMMMTAKARLGKAATVLAYSNSSDESGRRLKGSYTVGYTAVALTA